MNPEIAKTLRAKKLGILMKDARLSAGKTMKECGEAIGVSGSTISSYEKGKSSPSLPELELLSFFFKIPVSRFWKDTILASEETPTDQLDIEHSQAIRHRQIGVKIEAARLKLEKTYEEITEATGITYGRMKRFENGSSPIPVPDLELLSNQLEISMTNLFETETEVGQWIAAQSGISEFLKLPSELQTFIVKPINLPYLELASKLSKLSADELRVIAESLLEITI